MVREPNLKPLLLGNERPLDELGRVADRRRQRRRRARQHHRDPVHARGGRGARGSALGRRRAEAPAIARRRTRASTTPSRARRCADAAPGREPPAGPHAPRRRGAGRGRAAGLGHAGGRVPRLGHRRALGGAPARAADRGGHAHAPPRASAAPPARAAGSSRPGKLLVLGCLIGLLAAFWLATRQVYFVGVDESRGNVVTALPRPAVRPPARDPALLAGPALRRDAPERARPRAARRSPTTSCAPRTTPRASCSRWSRDASASERAQPRADGADPGVAAADGRVRRDLHPAQRGALGRLADLRRDLPRALLRRAPGDPLHAAARRPVPVPARRGARVLRAGRRLPDRRGPRARPGAVVRDRADRVRGRRSSLLRDFRVLERYRYTIALAGLALLLLPRVPGIGQQVNGAYLGVELGPISFQPAELGKIAIVIFLAAYLRDTRQVLVQGSRRFLGRDDPAAEALRAAARGLGRGDVHARLHPRPRLVADVLRRLPGADLRRHQPASASSSPGWRCSPPARGSSRRRSATCRTASTSGWTRSAALYDERAVLPDRQRAVRAGRRRAVRPGPGRGDAATCPDGGPLIPAPETDMIYAVIVNDLGLVGGVGRDRRPTC